MCLCTLVFETNYLAHIGIEPRGFSFKKHALYSYLETQGVKWQKTLSKKLLPDDAIYVINKNTVF
jgi:hypothetical protein